MTYRELLGDDDDIFAMRCYSHTLNHVGKESPCLELDKFMIALREMVAFSTEAKRLFRKNDSAEKNLAGYAKIGW